MRLRVGIVAVLAGCSGQDDCIEVPATCTPQYDPTWDGVWANTVSTSCALSGCHGNGSASGGLSMGDDPDEAYAAWQGYVVPGDPGCSLVVSHLEPDGIGDMPPGERRLSEEERCAVRTWIAQGADR